MTKLALLFALLAPLAPSATAAAAAHPAAVSHPAIVEAAVVYRPGMPKIIGPVHKVIPHRVPGWHWQIPATGCK